MFFFSSRRRHTRLQGDWSSDVCSSDLLRGARRAHAAGAQQVLERDGHAVQGPPRRLASVPALGRLGGGQRSEEHTSELQSPCNLVCRLLLEKKKKKTCNVVKNHEI